LLTDTNVLIYFNTFVWKSKTCPPDSFCNATKDLGYSARFCDEWHKIVLLLQGSGLPASNRLQKDAEQDESDAEVEGEIDLAAFAKNEESKGDGVTGFKIISQVDGEGGEALQRLDL